MAAPDALAAAVQRPVKVRMMTPHLPCGPEVEVRIAEDTPMLEVKRQLQEATGVPIDQQVVMLSAINQLVMGDKRTGLGFASCGTASSLYFALMGASGERE